MNISSAKLAAGLTVLAMGGLGAAALAAQPGSGNDGAPAATTSTESRTQTTQGTRPRPRRPRREDRRNDRRDDGPNHDANDDRGGDRTPGSAAGGPSTTSGTTAGDDGPNHDANDDRGGTPPPASVTTAPTTTPTTTAAAIAAPGRAVIAAAATTAARTTAAAPAAAEQAAGPLARNSTNRHRSRRARREGLRRARPVNDTISGAAVMLWAMSAPARVRKPDFLRVDDLDASELEALLELSARMKAEPGGWRDALPSETLACLFEKPSTRTRVSFQAAAHRLGMLPVVLRPDELQLGRGEPIADIARVLSSYCAGIVVRTFSQRTLEAIAGASSVPVINALSDDHHPCQALADLLTLQERFGRLRGLRLAYLGDGNNVAHSLMEAGALAGMEVRVATPAGYEPDPEVTAAAQRAASEHGGAVR